MRNSSVVLALVSLFCAASIAKAEELKLDKKEQAVAVRTAKTLLRGRDADPLDKESFEAAIDFLNVQGRSTLLSVFLRLDYNGDGKITELELETHNKFDHRGRSNKILDRIRDVDDKPILYEQIVKLAEEEDRSQGGWLDAGKFFALYDRNGDGFVSKKELGDFISVSNSQAEAQRIVRRAETAEDRAKMATLADALRLAVLPSLEQSNSELDKKIFLRKAKRWNTVLRLSYISELLRFDHDADGALSAQEIEDIKADFGTSSKQSRHFPKVLDDGYKKLTFDQISSAATEHAEKSSRWVTQPEQLFSLLDADNDGVISQEEIKVVRQEIADLRKATK